MTHPAMASVGVLATALVAAASAAVPVAGQTPTAAAKASFTWTVPRTLDGKPDLQGMWVNFDQTAFEQPLLSDLAKSSGESARAAGAAAPVAAGGGNGFGDQAAVVPRRPSMVVEPANGRVPVMAWAEKVREDKAAHIGDDWENGTTWDRCVTRGIPGAMFPAAYNNGYRIVQSPGYVTILYEMIHDARPIPTDGSPHLPSSIRLWDGDSRGHWEGDTLVVDISNYNGKGDIATNAASARMRGIPASDQLHVVERFTRVSDKTINYEVTITDPTVYTSPWKIAMPLTRDDNYRMFEYACHEGNVYFWTDTLRGGRKQDRAAAAGPGEDGK
jgi:hypothetical protein